MGCLNYFSIQDTIMALFQDANAFNGGTLKLKEYVACRRALCVPYESMSTCTKRATQSQIAINAISFHGNGHVTGYIAISGTNKWLPR